MIMTKPAKLLAPALFCAALVAGPASATTIEFTDWTSTNDPLLVLPIFTVNDDTAGFFDVFIDISGLSPETGLLTGIFIDLGYTGIEATDITSPSPGFVDADGPINIGDFENGGDVSNLGSGVNINPLYGGDGFDFAFGFDNQGPEGALSPITFTIDLTELDLNLTLADWTRVGLRFQSVGMGSDYGYEDSDKLIGTVIPLPAALPLFLIALGGLGLVARRRRKVTAA